MKNPDPDLVRFMSYVSESDFRQTLFDGLIVIAGLAICYMGYRLLSLGLYGDRRNSGELQASFADKMKLSVKNFAPGTIFAFCGVAMIVFALWRPAGEKSYEGAGNPAAQMVLLPPGITKSLYLDAEGDRIIQKALRGEKLTEEEKQRANTIADQLKNIPVAPAPGPDQPNQMAAQQ